MDIQEQQFQNFKGEVLQAITSVKTDLQAEMTQTRDALRQEIKDEGRTTRDYVDQKIVASEKRILEGVGQMISGDVLPQIDDHEERITKLEAKTT